MADRWVVNASPLIALGSIGRLDLLSQLAAEVVVPPAVAAEVRTGEDAASRAVAEAEGLRLADSVEPDLTVLAWGLGPGETEVLTLARRQPWLEAILDDLAARRCARSLAIPFRGTLGVVLLAKRRGVIPSAGAVVEELVCAGFHLSAGIVAAALALVGESR